MELVRPNREHLPSYVAALRAGWSADDVRGTAAAQEELARIDVDADAFLAGLYDPEARGGPVTLPDGSQVARLPGFRSWLWDGQFCGSIGLRWVTLTTDADNPASQRVILAAGGVLVEGFVKPAAYGGREGLRYRIDL